jgi:flagellar hook-associated protein 3 FlgL
MYRVTNSILTSNYLRDIQTNLYNLSTLQSQMSSGDLIGNGTDDPNGAISIMKLNREIAANEQYNTNIEDADNWLDTTDTVISQSVNVLSDIRVNMVKAGNGAYSEDEISALKDQVVACVQELGDQLNTSFNGAYIFGGTKTNSNAVTVDDDGNMSYVDEDGNSVSTDTSENITSTLTTDNQITSSTTSGTTTNTVTIQSIEKNSDSSEITITYSGSTTSGTTTTDTATNATITVSVTDSDGDGAYNDSEISSAIESALKADADINSAGFDSTSDASSVSTELTSILNEASNTINQIGSDLNAEISAGVKVNYNVSASDLLEFTDSDTGESINAMTVLSNIISNLKILSDTSATDEEQAAALAYINGDNLTQIDSISSNFSAKSTKVGTLQNRLETAKTTNEDQTDNMTSILSDVNDADYAEKSVEYASAQTVYKAALQVSSSILTETIMDYI